MIYIKVILPLFIFLLFSAYAQDSVSKKFIEAGRKYSRAHYQEAISLYEEIQAHGYRSADLYYNLGNAYFKNGDIARSILNYERALRLNPGDENAIQNLNIADARVRDRVEPIPLLFIVQWWNDLKNENTLNSLFLGSVGILWIFAISAFVFFGFGRILIRRIALVSGALSLCIFIATIFLCLDKKEDLEARRSAIIMVNAVHVKSAPDASGVETFAIHDGLKVEILDTKDSWCKIRLADGKDGWIPLDALERI